MGRIRSYHSDKGKKSKVPWPHMPALSSETDLRDRTHRGSITRKKLERGEGWQDDV